MDKDMLQVRDYCRCVYNETFSEKYEQLAVEYHGKIPKGKLTDIENAAQKEAIKQSIIQGIRQFPQHEPALIWKRVYEIHVHRKSGVDDAETIAKVISADQSWKKSSGHAFEEMIKFLGSAALSGTGIEIVLQRDLNTLIKAGELANEPRDISWLKEQIEGSIFDLYAVITENDKKYCFGCIQSKTSIRDRVTRDREPSTHAMASFFWSVAVVLDGDFMKNPKFINMVNGNTSEFPTNGWHGMYIFSDKYDVDRVYPTDIDMENFADHARKAALSWRNQRQWMDATWKA